MTAKTFRYYQRSASYTLLLKLKTENLIEQMRWKAVSIFVKIDLSKHHQNNGLCARNCPAVVEELREFEFDLQLMIKNVAFKKKIFFSNKNYKRYEKD